MRFKEWLETFCVYDPKVKVKKGCGFNWWGDVGAPFGVEIGGEVETANSDPDGTGRKHGRAKKCRE